MSALDDLMESWRVYEVDGKFYMVLSLEDFHVWQAEAPHLIHYLDGEACVEVTVRKKTSRKMPHHRKTIAYSADLVRTMVEDILRSGLWEVSFAREVDVTKHNSDTDEYDTGKVMSVTLKRTK